MSRCDKKVRRVLNPLFPNLHCSILDWETIKADFYGSHICLEGGGGTVYFGAPTQARYKNWLPMGQNPFFNRFCFPHFSTFNPRARKSPKRARISYNGLWMRGKAFLNRYCFPIVQNDRMDKHVKMASAHFSTFNPEARKSPKYATIS